VRDERWRWAWLGPDGSEAGHLGMTFLGDRVEVTASLARAGHDLVVLHEPDAPVPRAGSREIRASGLWADAIEEEQGRRWTIGLEAFALAVDHPDDAVGRRVPIGFDLEWERSGPDADRQTPALVHGEVLVETDSLDLDAAGWWRSWGPGEGHR
jgi:hypothetical protein